MGQARSRTVLVTGGAGFIGSHAVERFLQIGYDVVIVDDLSAGDVANIPAGAHLVRVDIRDDRVHQIIADRRPEIVVHCAAQVSVPTSMNDPVHDMQVNLLGTARIVHASRRAGVGRLVFLSSGGAIYGETTVPAGETTPPRPLSYYGVHKLAAEYHVALSGLSHAVLRPSNVYGPRQRHDQEGGVVSVLARQAILGRPLTITGDGGQTRDFVHVHDVANAIVTASQAAMNGTWNVSSGIATTINTLAGHLEHAVGLRTERHYLPEREGDVRASCLDRTRILRDLGWEPRVRFDTGVRGVLAYLEAYDARQMATAR